MLPSSKSPSTVPGRRAVPFLAASRSISAWGETTASGPSAPSPAPGRGDLEPKARSGAHGWEPSRSRAGPATAALPPPRVTRRGLPSPGLRARVCRSGCCADLDFARRGSSPPPTRVPSQRRLPLRRGRGPGPAGEFPQARWLCRPQRHQRVALAARGARVSAAAHPGELPAAHSAAQAAAPISPPDMLAWQAAGPRVTFLLEHFREAVSSGSATRRSENPGRAARPSLLQPQL